MNTKKSTRSDFQKAKADHKKLINVLNRLAGIHSTSKLAQYQ